MLTLTQLQAAWANPNVKAGSRVVRERESSQSYDAYRMVNGRPPFTDFTDHPLGRLTTPQGGRAAGAYQFLPTTWGRLVDHYGFADFSPASQDLGYVALVEGRGALADLMAGRFADFCAKCRPEWTSLPGAAESSPSWTLARAQAVFQQWGGTVAGEEAAAPIEDDSQLADPASKATADAVDAADAAAQGGRMEPSFGGMLQSAAPGVALLNPLAGLLTGLAGSLIQAFSPKLQERLTKVTGDAAIGAALTTTIMDTAKTLTGQSDPIAATAAAQKDPHVMAQIEVALDDHLDKLAPALDRLHGYQKDEWAAEDASRAAAGARALEQQKEGLKSNPTFILAIVLMAIIVGVVFTVLWKDAIVVGSGFSTDMQAFVIGAIVGGALTAVISFYFGSSRSSSAKDATIGQLATSRQRGA